MKTLPGRSQTIWTGRLGTKRTGAIVNDLKRSNETPSDDRDDPNLRKHHFIPEFIHCSFYVPPVNYMKNLQKS